MSNPWNDVFPKRGTYPNKLKSGVAPQLSAPTNSDSVRGRNRKILRNVWQTAPQGTLLPKNARYRGKWANSPFRVLNNAGDVLSRENYSCGGSNMVGSRPGMLNLSYGGGQSKARCDGTDIHPSTCNVKYVYDSSDFTKYRKLRALNSGYVAPDYSDGGSTSSYSLVKRKQPCQQRCDRSNNKRDTYTYDDVFGEADMPCFAIAKILKGKQAFFRLIYKGISLFNKGQFMYRKHQGAPWSCNMLLWRKGTFYHEATKSYVSGAIPARYMAGFKNYQCAFIADGKIMQMYGPIGKFQEHFVGTQKCVAAMKTALAASIKGQDDYMNKCVKAAEEYRPAMGGCGV